MPCGGARRVRCVRNTYFAEPDAARGALGVGIPVIGMGETCCHLASMFGHRFAFMLFIDRMVPLYQEQLRIYGLADRCAGIRPSRLNFQDMQGVTEPRAVQPRLQDAVRRVARDSGADVMIPGEVLMDLLLAMNWINRADGGPPGSTTAARAGSTRSRTTSGGPGDRLLQSGQVGF
jgi:Asp/Glu/hydantoin racemase